MNGYIPCFFENEDRCHKTNKHHNSSNDPSIFMNSPTKEYQEEKDTQWRS